MLIILDKVNYVYSIGSGFEMKALDDVSLTIDKGEFIGLIGHTGSGKSTLTQHLNGLLRATSGNIYYDGQDIYDKDFVMKNLRSKVGLYFSILNTSCSKMMYLLMCALVLRIWDSARRRRSSGLLRHLRW